MKKLIAFTVICIFVSGLSLISIAEAQPPHAQKQEINIEQKKAKIIADIDARIKILQEDRACVSAAKTGEDLKKCRHHDIQE
ncbi:MAG: hypothetical protein C0415_05550, partial [Thermodesulfovibrio sp.]|nr:hypothetical protein [Thermodesulfovibrio sp.]